MILIGFSGPMGSGKTTAARMVAKAKIKSFAAPLKEGVEKIFGFTRDQLYTMEGKNAIDPYWKVSPREMLQFLGTDCLRKRFPGFWVKRMELELKKAAPNSTVVIDDVRFNDEAELIRSQGGTVIHITGRRAWVEESLAGHQSERGIELRFGDIQLSNSGSLDDLRRLINRAMDHIREKENVDQGE